MPIYEQTYRTLRGARAAAPGPLLADHARGAAPDPRRSARSWGCSCWPGCRSSGFLIYVWALTQFGQAAEGMTSALPKRRRRVRAVLQVADAARPAAHDVRRSGTGGERPAHGRDPRVPLASAHAPRLRDRQAVRAAGAEPRRSRSCPGCCSTPSPAHSRPRSSSSGSSPGSDRRSPCTRSSCRCRSACRRWRCLRCPAAPAWRGSRSSGC